MPFLNKRFVVLVLALSAGFAVGAQERRAENSASVELPRGMVDPVPGNNTATDSDPIELVADLTITKTDNRDEVVVGGNTTYTLVASNLGPSASNGAIVADDWTKEPGLDCSAGPVTCAASGAPGAACPPAGSVTPAGLLAGLAVPTFPKGGVVTFTLQCLVTGTTP